MRAFIVSMLCFALLVLSGCAVNNRIPKGDVYPEMYLEMPKTVMVLPAVNHSTAADAPNLYSSTIAQPLANSGFYVLSTEITQKFLRNEGLSTGDQMLSIPPQKFSKIFGADAVLYVTIDRWDTNYYVIGGNVKVGISYKLKSTKTGAEIWSYANELVMDTSGDSNNGGGLLGALIATAIKTSTQDYVPIARNVNYIALNNIPYGGYHNLHGKDSKQMIVPPANSTVAQP
ncbi:MAG: DUF799 family lipoprotein [Gammaproteobacteria bacterium]|nr:DUF799 family lipoprotein [Gammaproteobacteria bacterium]